MEAFAASAQLENPVRRYEGACAAAQASCGQGKDAGRISDKEQQRWRQQALAWLRVNLAHWSMRGEQGKASERREATEHLLIWRQEPDLAGLREPAALARLPESEREAWQKLWTEVDELVTRSRSVK